MLSFIVTPSSIIKAEFPRNQESGIRAVQIPGTGDNAEDDGLARSQIQQAQTRCVENRYQRDNSHQRTTESEREQLADHRCP